MKACGIVAEYHPFHNGHRYQLAQAREHSQADVMVVAMSGNFTQRGEVALWDKWQRAAVALQNGADLIVELPPVAAVQAADYFAEGAVLLLQRLGCHALSFGVESGSAEQLMQLAKWVQTHQPLIEQQLLATVQSGARYAQRLTQALDKLVPESSWRSLYATPNNLLGFQYLKSWLHHRHVLPEVYPIKRQGAQHGQRHLVTDDALFASGTALRQWWQEGISAAQLMSYVPEQTQQLMVQSTPSNAPLRTLWLLLSHQLTVQTADELKKVYQMSEGIEHRLLSLVPTAANYGEFVTAVQNKRWSATRLQRLLLYVLIHWRSAEMDQYLQQRSAEQHVRVLAFNEVGQRYLHQLKQTGHAPQIIQTLRQTDLHFWDIAQMVQADRVYQQLMGQIASEQNFTRIPKKIMEQVGVTLANGG